LRFELESADLFVIIIFNISHDLSVPINVEDGPPADDTHHGGLGGWEAESQSQGFRPLRVRHFSYASHGAFTCVFAMSRGLYA
jgi:hypothetical protein